MAARSGTSFLASAPLSPLCSLRIALPEALRIA